ncbi:hypothetical protein VKT23_000086 [Stygiomarasmius scandens]|uniref:Uncharacterized protein n=1 Tax=Marasmiellus scandens TaxID=2682957 RepID=A0ABR1K8L4_9AGAR
MSFSSADDYLAKMTVKEILSRADLPTSSVDDLHPPPMLPVSYFCHKNTRCVAKIHIFARTAPKLAEAVFEFVDHVGPAHKGHKMAFALCDDEHEGNVTLNCSCGLYKDFGSMTYFEDMDFLLAVSAWDREEVVLKAHLKRE